MAALRRTVFARHQPESRTDLRRAAANRATSSTNARKVSATTGPTPGHRLQPRARPDRPPRTCCSRASIAAISRASASSTICRSGASVVGERRRQGEPREPRRHLRRAPRRQPIARLPQQRAHQRRCVPVRIATSCRRLRSICAAPAAPPTRRCVARYQPRRFASASAATSRRSVFTCRAQLAIHRRVIRIRDDHRRGPPPRAPAPPTRSPSPSRAESASARARRTPPPSARALVTHALLAHHRARPRRRSESGYTAGARSMAPYTMAGCSFLSALFPQGDTPVCGAQATTLGSSQPLHLISVCELRSLRILWRLEEGTVA